MTQSPVLVCRTRRQWRTTACLLRTRRPELAAKITLARLADSTAPMDEPLTIAFTGVEYERLLGDSSDKRRRAPAETEIVLTIADIQAFLGLSVTRESGWSEGQ